MAQNVQQVVVGGLAAVIIAGTIWCARNEGMRSRASTREAAKEAGSDLPKEVAEGTKPPVENAAEETSKKGPGASEKVPVEKAPVEKGEAVDKELKEPERISGEVIGEVKDTSQKKKEEKAAPPKSDSGIDKKPSGKPAGKPVPAPPVDPIQQLYDLGQRVSKQLDEVGQEAFALSWEEEEKIGSEVHKMVAEDEKVTRPKEVIERLERLAKPFLDQRSRKEVTYKFYVIDSSEINAFAHAGGYVYVYTGLLKFAKSDAELQFTLGHEIGHEDLKHVVKRMTYTAHASKVGGELAGKLAQIAYFTIAAGFSKEQELESDAWSFRIMRKAGRSREESLAGMKHLHAYLSKKKPEPKQSEPENVAEKTLWQINNHFMTHPPATERLARLEAIKD